MMNKTIYDKPIMLKGEFIELMNKPLTISAPLDPEFIEIDRLNRELEAAATYIEENEVVHLKYKKNIPTVIKYQGKRYVLDHRGDK